MATAEEILAKMTAVTETEAVCIIDPATRTISVPADFALLGVESDEKAERIKFRCPKVVGDNLNLTKFGIRINYCNASGEKDGYVVDDVAVDGEDITFSWLLGRKVTKYKGDVTFVVCAVRGTENEWNTTLATAKVLEGLEAEISGDEEDETLLEQLVAVTSQKLTAMSLALTEAKTQTEKTVQATKDAEIATKNAQDAAQAVFDQQYILTSETRFVGETKVEPSGEGAAIIKELQGGTKQAQTNGYQLFDASKLPTKSAGGVTVTNNRDGSFTISDSDILTSSFHVSHVYNHDEVLKMLKVGKITNSTLDIKEGPYCILWKGSEKIFEIYPKQSAEITEEILNGGTLSMTIGIYISVGSKNTRTTIYPMIYQDGDGTWEPYTGTEPSPSPDYPQEIKSIGSNGWFDGKLTVGGYQQNTGIYKDEYENYYTDFKQEYIPCKQGDVISIQSVSALTAKDVWFYREDKSFIKSISAFGNAVAPEETAYFRWDIKKTTTTWPDFAAVGKIAILKNGKYAARVKTVGKNLLDADKYYSDMMANGVIEDSAYNIYRVKIPLPKQFIGKKLTFSALIKQFDVYANIRCSAIVNGNIKDGTIVTKLNEYMLTKITFTMEDESDFIRFNYGTSGRVSIKNIQLEFDEYTSYSPYKSSTSYIPLDQPLYKGDKIYLEDGELWEYRENAKVVFDGSEDENWGVNSSNNGKYVYLTVPNIRKRPAILFCDKFVYFNDTDVSNSKITGITNSSATSSIYITMIDEGLGIDDATQWKTWLQSNPIEVVYKLATPTSKKLGSAEAFNIRTFDERTYIEVVGSKELGTENTFIVPRNQIGGLATDAFATAKRNEIQAAEQTNLASRIAALEALAVKER